MATIDCRPGSVKDPGGTWLKRGAAAAGLILAAFCGLVVIGLVVDPHPSVKPAAEPAAAPVSPPPPAPSTSRETATVQASDPGVRSDGALDYLGMKAEAEEKLRGVLTDDHGVRYRDVHTKLSTLEGGGIVAFCGEENSRTPLGGYGGFQRFIASRSVATVEGQMEPAEFAQAWSQFCDNAVEGPQVWF